MSVSELANREISASRFWQAVILLCRTAFLFRALREIFPVLEILLRCSRLWQYNLATVRVYLLIMLFKTFPRETHWTIMKKRVNNLYLTPAQLWYRCRITANELNWAVSSNVNGWMAEQVIWFSFCTVAAAKIYFYLIKDQRTDILSTHGVSESSRY